MHRKSPAREIRGPSPSVYTITLLSLAALGVTLQIAALGPLRSSFWGFHLYAFLPRGVAVVNWVILVLAAVVLLRRTPQEPAERAASGLWDRRPVLSVTVLAVVCTALFWLLRSQQTLLGDAQPLISDLPRGQEFHPRQPLTMWLQQMLYQEVGGWFRGEGVSESEVARRVVAAGSVVAGFFFVFVAFGLGRSLGREAGHGGTIPWLVTLLLLTQGYALLFFGYVENYTIYALFVGIYLLTGALYLQRRITLQIAALVLVISMGLHLSALGLLPSFVYLVARGLHRRDARGDALRGLAVAVGGVLVLDWILRTMSPGYSLWSGLEAIVRVARTSQGGGAGMAYIFSWTHARDFLNEHYLIGPLGALLFVPALVFAFLRGGLRKPVEVFLALSAAVFLGASWVTSDPLLGYARDWDLFAPAGVCYSAAAFCLLLVHVSDPRKAARLLVFALCLSFLNLAAWVRINNSEALSLVRFKTLPLGYGRTEVAVANWYFRHERFGEASRWCKKALETTPYNANAYSLLGILSLREEKYDLACEAFGNAVALRPDKPGFRRNYARALLSVSRYEEALTQLRWLVEREPDDVVLWRAVTLALTKLDRTEELREANAQLLRALERTLADNPNDESANVEAGVLLLDFGRPDEALARFRRALAANPRSAAALFNTGLVLARMGRDEEARPVLERFLELYPDHPQSDWVRQRVRRR